MSSAFKSVSVMGFGDVFQSCLLIIKLDLIAIKIGSKCASANNMKFSGIFIFCVDLTPPEHAISL